MKSNFDNAKVNWTFRLPDGLVATGNDGSVVVMGESEPDEDGETDSIVIATVHCVTKFKRGEGWKTHCEQRNANARLIAAAPRLKAALRNFLELVPALAMPMTDGEEIVPEHPLIIEAKKALAESE